MLNPAYSNGKNPDRRVGAFLQFEFHGAAAMISGYLRRLPVSVLPAAESFIGAWRYCPSRDPEGYVVIVAAPTVS